MHVFMYVCMHVYVCMYSQVAAKVEEEALWILATVEKHNEKKGIFVVVDDDAGEDKRRRVIYIYRYTYIYVFFVALFFSCKNFMPC